MAHTLKLLADGSRSLAYVSLGSGFLLYELEVLAALQEAGVALSSVVLVDRGYSVGWGHAALEELAAFLAPVRVAAYGSLGGYAAACLRGDEPPATLLMQADVPQITPEDTRALACISLAAGGLCFRLNAFDRGRACANMDCWQRRGDGSMASIERARAMTGAAAGAPAFTLTEADVFAAVESEALLVELGRAVPITPSGI